MPKVTAQDLVSPSDSILRQTLRDAAMGVAWLDATGHIISVNQTLANWLNQNPSQLNGQPLGQFVPRLDEPLWRNLWHQLTYAPFSEPRTALVVEQESRLLDLLIQRLPGEQQDFAVVYLSASHNHREQNTLHNLQAEVLEAVARGKSLAESMGLLCQRVSTLAPEVICTVLQVDEQGRVHPLAASSGMPEAFNKAIDSLPIGPSAGSCGTAAYRGEPVETVDIALDPLWDEYRKFALPLGLRACWSSPIKSRAGRVVATFALYYRQPRKSSPFHRQLVTACLHVCSLAIEHHEAEQRIHQLAFFDTLTRLPNRELLQEQAQRELLRAVREKRELAMFFLDLDRFKHVNDSLGHAIGDRLLVEISQRLLSNLRESDTISRLGGDEFVLLLPQCNDSHARVLAEKLLLAIAEPVTIDQYQFNPTASIGIGIFPRDGTDFESLLRNTDAAMYHAKGAGRNTYRFFRPEMNIAANERLVLESAFRQALHNNEIQAHFQPILRFSDQQLAGVEALARWQHPQRGMISPATFIPLAEECGLINRLDQAMLRAICQQLAQWRERGIVIPGVAVNLSAQNFREPDLAERVASVLQEFSIPPGCLTLEITESLMLHGAEHVLDSLQALRTLGVRLAVDDFGTGFSSLSYLAKFPVHELKLDQSFVRSLLEDGQIRALSSAIISIGHRLQLTVVAEGVETAGQLDFLQQEGCDMAQGYYFARPVPAAELEQWLARHQASNSNKQ